MGTVMCHPDRLWRPCSGSSIGEQPWAVSSFWDGLCHRCCWRWPREARMQRLIGIQVQRPGHPGSKSRVIPTAELHTGAVVEPVSQPTCPSDPLPAPLPQLLVPQELPNEHPVLSAPLRVCFPETQTATQVLCWVRCCDCLASWDWACRERVLSAKTGWTVLKMGSRFQTRWGRKGRAWLVWITEGKSERWKKESEELWEAGPLSERTLSARMRKLDFPGVIQWIWSDFKGSLWLLSGEGNWRS